MQPRKSKTKQILKCRNHKKRGCGPVRHTVFMGRKGDERFCEKCYWEMMDK